MSPATLDGSIDTVLDIIPAPVVSRFLDDIDQTALFNVDRDDDHFSYYWDCLLLDVHLMRSGIFCPSRAQQPEVAGFHSPQRPNTVGLFAHQTQGPLVVRDAMLFGEILTRYWRGWPDDLRVALSLNDAARAMGYRDTGGEQRRAARASLGRLVATTLRWAEFGEDGRYQALDWHLLDEVRTIGSSNQYTWAGQVRLSRISARLAEDGMLQYLHSDICRELVVADEVATRLWMFLECERLPHGEPWRYSIFRAKPGAQPRPKTAPVISEICGFAPHCDRRKVVHRLKSALEIIKAVDVGRYRLDIHHSPDPGMYRLDVRRWRRSTTGRREPGSAGNAPGRSVDAPGSRMDAAG